MQHRRSFLAGVGALAAGCARPAPALTVFAAASLQDALTAVGQAWAQAGGAPATFSFGASPALARQIAQGAPADLFVSADEAWMDWLADRRLIRAASRHDLLSNRLALIAPARSDLQLAIGPGMSLARALGEGRLAVADVTAVPAGRYARAALEALGVWPSVEHRLLPGESVRAALAYVARGEAPLGVVYATDAAAEPGVRLVGLFPADSHPPIRYPVALVAASRHRQAGALLDFLRGPRAMAIFRRHGFGAPPASG